LHKKSTALNPKIENILKTSRELFWKHGFKRVSVEEICKKANVSKMTFYRYFSDKIELAKTVYDKEVDKGVEKFREILFDESNSPLTKMELLLQLKMEGIHDISKEFLQDFYSSPELGLSKHVEEKTKSTWDMIISDFRAAQEKGWFRKDFKPETFMILTSQMTELISDERILAQYASPQEMIMEFAKFYTYGILERQNAPEKPDQH
jgi:AcrR family transcriptional regulator